MQVCCKTCHSATSPREELTLLCLGLEGAGKSTLLATLAGETVTEEVQPTLGFSIKAVVTQRAVFNVKELGGGEMIRQYWERYFSGHNGLVRDSKRTKKSWFLHNVMYMSINAFRNFILGLLYVLVYFHHTCMFSSHLFVCLDVCD